MSSRIRIVILKSLRDEIFKTFKKDSLQVYKLLNSLRENPNKGKKLGKVNGITIKELKHGSFRFCFILDDQDLILYNKSELEELLIRFIEVSRKRDQHQSIDRIRLILKCLDY